MDQVKVVLAVLGKHHFWALCGLVIIVALAVYASASANLSGQYEERTAAINGKVDRVQGIGANPPNEVVINAKKEKVGEVKDKVLRAWEFLYKLQQEKNPWPAELGEDFLNMINSLGPKGTMPILHLETYHTFINNHFPALFDIIEVRKEVYVDEQGNVVNDATVSYRTSSGGYTGTYGDGGDEEEDGGGRAYSGGRLTSTGLKTEIRGKVEWSNPEVLALGRDWISRPTTFQVRLAQEDLWVYEALLRIIRDTNTGATSYHNAAIKRIDALQIGQAAAAAFATSQGRILAGGSGSAMVAAIGGSAEESDGGEEDEDSGGSGGGGYFGTLGLGVREALLQGRYVGLDGQPLPHDATAFAEFDLMPVRLILYMDQSKIPDLLVNRANSSMPVEVRRISLFPGAQGQALNLGLTGGTGGSSSYRSEDGDEEDYGDEDEEGGGYGGYGGYSVAATSAGTKPGVDSKDIPVEVLGVIQIFNYPDREKLGTGSAGEGAVEAVMPIKAPPEAPTAPPEEATPPATTEPSPPADAASPDATGSGA